MRKELIVPLARSYADFAGSLLIDSNMGSVKVTADR